MITLEASRRAARPLRRHQFVPEQVALFCQRCDRFFHHGSITTVCGNCQRASERLYGSAHPRCEMSGA